MACELCNQALELDDNYCRRCGASVQREPETTVPVIVDPTPAGVPVRTTQSVDLLRATLTPLATGVTAVLAAGVAKWMLKRAVLGAVDAGASRTTAALLGRPTGRTVTARRGGGAPVEVVEAVWYRRISHNGSS